MSILLDGKVKPVFGRHEKFAFRHGWLKKGVDAARENSTIFSSDQALVKLGVGKNMVRSIRHWCQAVGFLEEIKSPSRALALGPTALADSLLRTNRWDPYLEDTASIWLIHWNLVTNLERGLVWNLAFTSYLESEFTKQQLVSYLVRQFERLNIRTTQGMIKREVDCFLRTYVTDWSKTGALSEASLDCPLAELNLIRLLPEDGVYRFNIGPKPSLPTVIFGYALLNYLAGIAQTRRTVALEECVYQPGSPGQAFKLDENSVTEYIEAIEGMTADRIRLQETAGLRQIYIHETDPDSLPGLALELLNQFYV